MNDLIKRLIVFLIRKKLGLKKNEVFIFENQKSQVEYYWFTGTRLRKMREDGLTEHAHVSLNWLIDDECCVISRRWCVDNSLDPMIEE